MARFFRGLFQFIKFLLAMTVKSIVGLFTLWTRVPEPEQKEKKETLGIADSMALYGNAAPADEKIY